MPGPGLGTALALAVFGAGVWSGAAWADYRRMAQDEAARAMQEARAAGIRTAEVARLASERTMELNLGEVIGDEEGLDRVSVVFDARRVQRLFAAE